MDNLLQVLWRTHCPSRKSHVRDDAAILGDACNETDYANAIIHLADSQSTRNIRIPRGQQIVKNLTVEQYVHRLISVSDELSLYFR